ncbi:hypothetical protein [Fimbriiglobus ruber]|uniref:Uncharacterized protein n=1 Tax=Fimbriiglobus ruber TaxID=1908690 RepID=A0A225D3X8_9BACT|nr:hypothetical protein [Fimbriiglobus ruber]OWK34344.1 hypothetical protein FRUB_10315 [Fimbriiglobus ruber]
MADKPNDQGDVATGCIVAVFYLCLMAIMVAGTYRLCAWLVSIGGNN